MDCVKEPCVANDHRPFLIRLFSDLADELGAIVKDEEDAVEIGFQPVKVSDTLTCGEFKVTTPATEDEPEEVKTYRVFAGGFHRHLNRDWSMLLLERADGRDKGRMLVSNNSSAIYTLLVNGW